MRIKTLLLFLTLSAGISSTVAQTTDNPTLCRSVEIISTEGRHYGVNLTPSMKFFFNSNADFVVTEYIVDENGQYVHDEETGQSLTKTLVEFPGLKFKEMILSPSLSGVESANKDFHFNYDISSGILTAGGFTTILIYSSNGMIEDRFSNMTNDMLQIDMKAYGAGVHIVKVDSENLKLLVK